MTYVSHADLGGTMAPGAIVPEPEGELFHHAWEPKVLALNVAAGATGRWNIDVSRSYRERLPDYADLSYYEIWFEGLERLLVARGLRVGRRDRCWPCDRRAGRGGPRAPGRSGRRDARGRPAGRA